jgi:ceramide glucosyltransferase
LILLEDPLGILALAWALVVASVAAWAVIRAPRKRANPAKLPAVLVIRPCGGIEPWLEETLVSFLDARYSFKPTMRFTVASADDPALPTIQAAAVKMRQKGIDAAVLVCPPLGPNRKASQLAAVVAADEGRHKLILSADSDVDLEGVDLDGLVLPLTDPQVGASWAPPVERWPVTGGDAAMAAVLSSSLHSFPLLAGLDHGGMVGKLFAWRPVSDASFEDLVHFLGEDMELARRLRARGLRVAATNVMAPSRASGRSWEEVVSRFSRWLLVIRSQRPVLMLSYPILIAATGPIVLLGLLAMSPLGLFAAITAITTRLGVALAARDLTDEPGGQLVTDAIRADALIWAGFWRAIRSPRFTWRGHSYRIAPDGRMVAESPKR